jgi:hypothetical protein
MPKLIFDGTGSSNKMVFTGPDAGNDANTVSLLHGDGANMSTTFTDSATGGTHTWAQSGAGAYISTTQKEFGTASMFFDSTTNGFISTPTSTDFNFGTGNFTIDFWLYVYTYLDGPSNWNNPLAGAYADTNNLYQIWMWGNTTGSEYAHQFYHKDSSTVRAQYRTGNLGALTGAWHHIAWVRNGATMLFFLDGVSKTLTETVAIGTITNINGNYTVGCAKTQAGAIKLCNAYIDEFRVSKGIARWTSGFTPPTVAYTTSLPNKITIS